MSVIINTYAGWRKREISTLEKEIEEYVKEEEVKKIKKEIKDFKKKEKNDSIQTIPKT